ncbi:hypothetical protein DFP72DRAFT_423719 [Ephemerocybe angulata]|uniref:F-box domain-containing protein n=1 Tax=Ephemerocybe angulata TaxID=980116 RepID=A0A8H6IF59_9AGAR|nr:hypothetical protein DFP72DRAFT_423719 [Tulosesus angulatus]
MAPLTDTPVELLFKIAADLDAIDVFRLSQACKLLHEMASQHQVWATALRGTCRSSQIFEPTYPIDSMELPHLRRAALAPWRPVNILPGPEIRPGSALRNDTILPQIISGHCVAMVLRVHLIPGGRYLIELVRRCFQIWDLGVPWTLENDLSSPVVICTQNADTGLAFNDISKPVRSGTDTLRMIAHGVPPSVSLGDNDSASFLQIYEIGPLPKDCRIRLLAKHRVGDLVIPKPMRYWLSGDRVYFVCDDTHVLVWDYIRSLYASWNLVPSSLTWEGEAGELKQCTSVGDIFIVWTETRVVALNIPQLCDMNPSLSLSELSRHPVNPPPTLNSTFRYPSDTPRTRGHDRTSPSFASHVLIPSIWYQLQGSSLIFDLVIRPRLDSENIKLTRLHCDVSRPRAMLQIIQNKTIPRFSEGTAYLPLSYELSLNHAVVIFLPDRDHNFYASPYPIILTTPPLDMKDADKTQFDASVTRIKTRLFWRRGPDICPTSGRAAYVCDLMVSKHPDCAHSIHVGYP